MREPKSASDAPQSSNPRVAPMEKSPPHKMGRKHTLEASKHEIRCVLTIGLAVEQVDTPPGRYALKSQKVQ